jgi:hypothetical protein
MKYFHTCTHTYTRVLWRVFVFLIFKNNLWCNQTGNHPQEKLAKIGYKSERKILKSISIYLPHWRTFCPSGLVGSACQPAICMYQQQSSASAAEFGSLESAFQSPESANSSIGKWLPTLCLLSRGGSPDCHLTIALPKTLQNFTNVVSAHTSMELKYKALASHQALLHLHLHLLCCN